MLGRLLAAARINLAKYDTDFEFRFLAASIPIGSETIVHRTVETNAILIVSTMPIQAVEQVKSKIGYAVHTGYAWGSITLQLGGQRDSRKNMIRFSPLPESLPQSSTNPSITQTAQMITRIK